MRTFAQFDIKLFDDDEVVTTGEAFQFAIPEDLNYWFFNKAAAYVSTPSSSGDITLDIGRRRWSSGGTVLSSTGSLLSFDFLTIDEGSVTSYDSATPLVYTSGNYVVSNAIDDERWILYVTIESPGTGAKGLGVILDFGLKDANA